MTLKVDGTNGVLQAYDYQVLTTGFAYTFAAGTQVLVMNPAGTLATGTITMPAAPVDGMNITISSTQQITALTINGNTGQSIVGNAASMQAGGAQVFIYRLSNTTWYSQDNNATLPAAAPVTSVNSATGAVVTTNLYSIGASILGRPANNTSYAVDSTIAGSSLYSVSINSAWYNPGGTWNNPNSGGGAQTLINTGSWRCQSPASSDGSWGQPGIWIRYA